MTKEQKEGVLIATVSLIAMLILALLMDWDGGLLKAHVTFEGFEQECEFKPAPSYEFYMDKYREMMKACPESEKYLYGFSIDYSTFLIFLLPLFSYGVLRAFGVVRRLFKFEEQLSKILGE